MPGVDFRIHLVGPKTNEANRCSLLVNKSPESDNSEGMIEYNNFRIGDVDSYFKLEQLGGV